MDLTDILLSLHILAVAVWFGGSVMNGIINMKVMAAQDLHAAAVLARSEVKLGLHVYMPASIITLLTGVGLVVEGSFDWGAPWISLGFLTVIAAAVLGPVKFMPLSERLATALEGKDVPAAEAAGKELRMWSMVTTGLLLVTIVAMVWKP